MKRDFQSHKIAKNNMFSYEKQSKYSYNVKRINCVISLYIELVCSNIHK